MRVASTRRRRATARRSAGRVRHGAEVLVAGVAGAALAYLFDPDRGRRRRHVLRDRASALGRRGARRTARHVRYAGSTAVGVGRGALARRVPHERQYDDVTLAHKVESELFRPAGSPKGSVSVNVNDGVVELRGQLADRAQIERLGHAAARVEGVRHVENLLHTPGSPPGHSPPSDPADVRRRAGANGARRT